MPGYASPIAATVARMNQPKEPQGGPAQLGGGAPPGYLSGGSAVGGYDPATDPGNRPMNPGLANSRRQMAGQEFGRMRLSPQMGGGDPRAGWSGPSADSFRRPSPSGMYNRMSSGGRLPEGGYRMSDDGWQAMRGAYGSGGDNRGGMRAMDGGGQGGFWNYARRFAPQGGMVGQMMNGATPDQDFQRERQRGAMMAMRSRSGEMGGQGEYQDQRRPGMTSRLMEAGQEGGQGGGGMRSMLLRALMGGG